MSGDKATLFWHWGCLITALVILPIGYFCLMARLREAARVRPPRLEFFVAFGTLGGFLLTGALSPSPLSLPCGAFTVLVALPASLFFGLRLALQRDRRSRFHKAALVALCMGVLLPVLLVGIAWSLDLK